MKHERWPQIEQLYLAALERRPSERAAFLDQACAGDAALRREVESLLACHTEAKDFIEAPAVEVAAGLLAETSARLASGQEIGPYKIINRLGAGGMGEVYLVQDSRLGRKVALKLLPAQFTNDLDRVRRFEQEARAASALNHPNIITIYEIGQVDGDHFIATEFIDGQTLRQRATGGRLKLLEALEVVIQVASALAAAHEVGIVHRDIKPENIMLRHDGYVKVLDFGLAKLTERQQSEFDTQAPTVDVVQTEPGTVMGTVAYMSPEQTRGLKVDARSDIFSLGVVLYELLAERRPFVGKTTADVMAAILHLEPTPLARLTRDVPETLEWMIAKALRKEPEARYQTVKDLLMDLKSLKQRLEIQAELARSAQPEMPERARVISHEQTIPDTAQKPAAETNAAASTLATSSAEYLISEIKRHKAGVTLALVVLLLIVTGIGFWLYQLVGQRQMPASFQRMQFTKLTTTGKAIEAAISPDGKYVAYVLNDAEGQSIWVRHVATSSNVQIAPTAEVMYGAVTFSPNGNYVYYSKQEKGVPANILYQVSVLGGAPKKITERVHGGLTFSPDGKRIAFARWKPGRGDGPRSEKLLIVMNADGTGEQKLTSRWAPEVLVNAAWSPDGKVIACTVDNYASSGGAVGIIEVRVADGTERPISAQKWFNVGRVAWLPDGSGLIVPASDKPSSPPQIWHLSYPGGEARRITNDLNGYNHVSLTADTKALALVTVQSDQSSNIWVAPGGDVNRAKQMTFGVGKYGSGVIVTAPTGAGSADGGGGICWTPDGRIVYHSMASGKLDLWIMNADGSNQKQLTADAGSNFFPSVSPDGRYIVFQSDRTSKATLWRMDGDGDHAKQLTSDGGEFPSCSPDGKWVAYMVTASGRSGIWKVPMEGGAPVQITNENDVAERPAISPDGKLVACNYVPPGSDWQVRIAALSFEGGRPEKVFQILTIDAFRQLRWTADGQTVAYIETRQGVSNIWGQPLAGGPPVQLTNFKSDLIFSWDWSRDGKQLAIARGQQISDVVLISDFR